MSTCYSDIQDSAEVTRAFDLVVSRSRPRRSSDPVPQRDQQLLPYSINSLNAIQPGEHNTRMAAGPKRHEEHSPSIRNRQQEQTPLRYAALTDDQSSRFLKLHPGSWQAPLCCSLFETKLNRPILDFEALSYVWGTESATDELTLYDELNGDEMKMHIKPNLAAALRQLRYSSGSRNLWIDAVCIDQSNPIERAHQVDNMGSIFSKASRVLVWLGSDKPDLVRPAMRSVNLLARQLIEQTGENGNPENISLADFQSFPTELCYKVAKLFERDWFWRLWCVQELVLSKSALFLWAGESVDWDDVSRVTAALVGPSQYILHSVSIPAINNSYFLRTLRESDDQAPKLPLWRMLSLTRQYEVSDERDRVYSLLGLASLTNGTMVSKPLLSADYEKSLSQLYLEVATNTIQKDGNLLILSCVQHNDPHGHLNSPSWVPQWKDGHVFTLSPLDRIASRGFPSNGFQGECYVTSNFLYCQGIVLDFIIGSTEVFNELDGRRQTGATIYSAYRHVEDLVLNIHKTRLAPYPDEKTSSLFSKRKSIGEAFYRALLGGSSSDHDSHTQTAMANFIQAIQSPCDPDYARIGSSSFARGLREAREGRRMFVTGNGFIGLGPAALLPGDSVCSLVGAAVPMILRQGEGHFLLVGKAYVEEGKDAIAKIRANWKAKEANIRQKSEDVIIKTRAKLDANEANNVNQKGGVLVEKRDKIQPSGTEADMTVDADPDLLTESQQRRKVQNRLAQLAYSKFKHIPRNSDMSSHLVVRGSIRD